MASRASYIMCICCYNAGHEKTIGPFRHPDISVEAVNQHGGRVLVYIV